MRIAVKEAKEANETLYVTQTAPWNRLSKT